MNIIVCVKQVADTNIIAIDEISNSIDEKDLIYVANQNDLYALEHALDIKEKNSGSHITVISLGPLSTKKILRHCLSLGADKAILVSDLNQADLDSYATGLILAKAISRLQYDLILCGEKASDTNAGMVGPIIANILNIPLLSKVTKFDCINEKRYFIAQRKLGKGNQEVVKSVAPALLTTESYSNELRYASLPTLLWALNENIEEYSSTELGLTTSEFGSQALKTEIQSLSPPKPRPKKIFTPDSKLSAAERMKLAMTGGVKAKQGDILEGSPEEIANKFIQFLSQQKLIS